MNQFDQHNAILSLEQALVPTAGLIDSRTEADNLRLLVDFASLFNFYDQTNKINGNWSPFLLKDPVFLVASIAKTSFKKAYSLFINTCLQLEVALNKEINNTFISNAFNQLFDQLTYVFQTIERWTHYSQESSIEYNLKTYIVTNVKNTYSLILWSLLDLRQQLFNYGKTPDITVNIPKIKNINKYAFENYDKKIWKESKGELPYWTVLGLPTSPCNDAADEQCFYISELTQKQLFTALHSTGKKVFAFYSNCISYADTELQSVQTIPGHFPDTILLRTFTSLLKIYKTQLNSLSEKHLNFYYGDILKQLPKIVSPDTVFAASNLAKTTATFQLPKSTVFTAGLDANKQTILFETTNNVSLNPAKIANAYVLSQKTVTTYNTEVYLNKLPPVNVVAKEEDGAIKTWKTFGSQIQPEGDACNMAIAFGSPLLYLTAATSRVITLDFTLSSSTFTDILQEKTKLYLSTEKAWFEIPASQITFDFTTPDYKLPMTIDRQLKMIITLLPTHPVIAAFTKNPDGYTCDWPLFKMQFSEFEDLANPPKIKTLDINVAVNGLQNFQLYNDFGQLNAKKPFQPLGPTPTVHQSFMVGSAEIFSKPAQDINFQLTWNVFPTDFDFATYYEEYNNYLNNKYSGEPINIDKLKKLYNKIIESQKTLFTNIRNSQQTLFENVLKSDTAKAIQFIQLEQTKLTALINAESKTLTGLTSSDNALVKDIIDLENAMATSINSTESILITDIQTAETVDSSTVTTAENTVLNEIMTTQNAVSQKILDAENTLLTTTLEEKKSLFKRITSSIGSIFHSKKTIEGTPEEPTVNFSNTSFMVDFECLQNGLWETFNTKVSGNVTSSSTPLNLFFPLGNVDNSIPPTRAFDFAGIDFDPTTIDPTLQKTPLQLLDTSTTGFLKMKLLDPMYGFGTDLYPKVVGAIALFNAQIIAEKIKTPSDTQKLVSPPNIPFIPMVSLFAGNYTASISYNFSNIDKTYPLECFYNTPFENYKVFDTANTEEKITTKYTTFGSSPERDKTGTIIPLTGLPLVPTFSSKGQLFLELQDVIVPAKVSFYFELARTYTEGVVPTNKVTYSYLSTDGWKTLTSIADGTNNFTCSGIITINIPEDITNDHETIAGTNFWIAIGAATNPDNFPQTSFLKTNGITLQRILPLDDLSTVTPQIKANIITSPKTAIPEIGSTVQPFASFGGKAAETNQQMNSRVSTRLKTKDRLSTAEDYFNVIRLEFPEVYYSKTIYRAKKATTYVIKRVSDATETNAFAPLLSECNELEIQNYIEERVSTFVKVSVENFELNYVQITADIQLNSDEDVTTVAKEINTAINLFLAPWITSAQAQITVDTGLNTAQLASFINSYDSVLEVSSISLQIGTKNFTTGNITYETESMQGILQKDRIILVPSLNNLTKNSLITYHL